MTSDVITPSKQVADTLTINFPFQDQMAFGEVVNGAAVTIAVASGVDPNPTPMLIGLPDWTTGVGQYVLQQIGSGVPGVIYNIVCSASTSLGNGLIKRTKLAVVNLPTAY